MDETKNLLDEFDTRSRLEYATPGQRFANYVFDTLFLYVILIIYVVAIISTDSAFLFLMIYPIMISYYMFAEGLMNGKTVGKFFTKTTVVYDDGSPISMQTSIVRGLCRLVPFEPFSGFDGYPWHDQWTKTRVVKDSSLSR